LICQGSKLVLYSINSLAAKVKKNFFFSFQILFGDFKKSTEAEENDFSSKKLVFDGFFQQCRTEPKPWKTQNDVWKQIRRVPTKRRRRRRSIPTTTTTSMTLSTENRSRRRRTLRRPLPLQDTSIGQIVFLFLLVQGSLTEREVSVPLASSLR
jgi:hypothetical protein